MAIFLLQFSLFLFLSVLLLFPSGVRRLPLLLLSVPQKEKKVQVQKERARVVLLVLLSSFIFLSYPVPAFADIGDSESVSLASPSDSIEVSDVLEATEITERADALEPLDKGERKAEVLDEEDLDEDGLFRYILHRLIQFYYDSGDSSFASPSNALFSSKEDKESLTDDEEGPEDIIPYVSVGTGFRSVPDSDHFVNVLRYDVSISGRKYTLLFPPEYADSLYIDHEGRLFNVSTTSIQGRLIEGTFNPLAKTGKLLYLTPCLGNNFYSLHEYGSPNYVREYYYVGSRLNYRDTYSLVTVTGYHHMFKVSDTLWYILLVLIGGCLICLWRKSSR